LNFGGHYFWRVKVKDSEGFWSSNWSSVGSFDATPHRWPIPKIFSPSPSILGRPVVFIDESTCFDANNTAYPCQAGDNIYLWVFGDGQTSTDKGNTSHTYSALGDDNGNYNVTLWVADQTLWPDSGECFTEYPLKVSLGLPRWKEIAP
jgi:hypothetical protein